MKRVRIFPIVVDAVAGISALAVFSLFGCARYRLGTTLPAHLRTVHVSTFSNSTPEVGIEAEVTNEVITRFRVDGNLAPVSPEAADSLLRGEIVEWRREVLIYTGPEKDEVEEYRLYVIAEVTFRDLRRDREIFTRRLIRGETDFVVNDDMREAELSARPAAFRDLARRVVDEVTAYW